MDNEFLLEVFTPERPFFRGKIESLVLSTIAGEMGVLKNNMPLVTALKEGCLQIKEKGEWKEAATSTGFVQVRPDKVLVFCETVFWPDEMDEAVLLGKESKQKEEMENAKSQRDFIFAKAALSRTFAKLAVKRHDSEQKTK